MKKQDYTKVLIITIINYLVISYDLLRYFIYVSKFLMVLYAISSLSCTILIFVGIVKRKINIFVGLVFLFFSLKCLKQAVWILEAFFHVDNLFL